MPMYDFHCPTCSVDFEELSFYSTATGGVMPVDHYCGTRSEVKWKKAPGLKSDEKLPRDLQRAAQVHWGRTFESRAEHDRFCAEQGVTPEIVRDIDTIAKHTKAQPDDDEDLMTPDEEREIEEIGSALYDKAVAGALPPAKTARVDEVDGAATIVASEVKSEVES